MGNVALREYHRKIENLIEIHQIEDALSHCANIIHKYPREIESYRKLGKIFLEKQDFSLSQKIFEVILSVFPDDFVANVGLSYIHEHQGDLDKAIHHMLMAFELQPANPSLQDELKRLYNKRDNTEPNKIRLTRGALIKMYARSSLYEQAIAEIKLGLYEKPNRIDFKLILTEMLWKSGKHIEAVETAVDVVSQLPYCWKANEILDKAFQDLHEGQTDNNYRSRLIELDPYYRYMLPSTKAVADIPDIAEAMEDEPERANEIKDWDDFLSRTWAVASLPAAEEAVSSDLNWDAILEEADKEKADEEAIPSAGLALFDELSRNRAEIETPLNTRRQNFIERLQRRSQPSPEEFEDASKQEMVEPEIQSDSPTESAPSEEPEITLNDEFIADLSVPAESEPAPEPVAPLPEESASAALPPALESEPADQVEDSTTGKQEEVEDGVQAPEMEFPSVSEEGGAIDHDAPVEIPAEAEAESSSLQWVSDVFESQPSKEEPPNLQDTQQIKVAPLSPDEMLQQARGMIESGNMPFALRYIQHLAQDDSNLEGIRVVLEGACEQCPQESNLWLALGNVYQRLDLKEKALEVFTRAQKHITL